MLTTNKTGNVRITGRVREITVVVEKQLVFNYEYVFVALGIQHARRMRHIVICVLPRSTIFFHNIS